MSVLIIQRGTKKTIRLLGLKVVSIFSFAKQEGVTNDFSAC